MQRFRILKGQIIEKSDHRSQVPSHRCKHPQRELWAFAQQFHEFSFWYNNHRAQRQRARGGGIAFVCSKRGLRKGVAGMKDMNDLHFPRSVDTVDVDHASL